MRVELVLLALVPVACEKGGPPGTPAAETIEDGVAETAAGVVAETAAEAVAETAAEAAGSEDLAPAVSVASCRAWLAGATGAGLPDPPGPGPQQRKDFLAAGGGLVPLDNVYYSVWLPDAALGAPVQRLWVALHGTGGYPEAEWKGWHASLEARGIGHLALLWNEAGVNTAEDVLYERVQAALDEVASKCPIGKAKTVLMGFSVGSAISYAVTYRDLHAAKRFVATVAISGAAWMPMESGKALHPLVESPLVKDDPQAYLGARFWMYCGGKDDDHGWPMCDEVEIGRAFVADHGGQATIFEDPQGSHGSLPQNPTGVDAVLDFVEGS